MAFSRESTSSSRRRPTTTSRADRTSMKFCEPRREICSFSSFLDWFWYRSSPPVLAKWKWTVDRSLKVGCFNGIEAVLVCGDSEDCCQHACFLGVVWTQFTVSVCTDLKTVETVFLLEWHQALEAFCRDGERATQLHGLYCDTNTVSSQTIDCQLWLSGFSYIKLLL